MLVVAAALSGGVKRPDSRNDLALDMRTRDEAEGERSITGSSRRDDVFGMSVREHSAHQLQVPQLCHLEVSFAQRKQPVS